MSLAKEALEKGMKKVNEESRGFVLHKVGRGEIAVA